MIVLISNGLNIKFLLKLKQSFKYNAFIRLSIEAYLDICFGIIIQINAVKFDSVGDIMNFVTLIICILIILISKIAYIKLVILKPRTVL